MTNPFTIEFHGVRGSIATPGPDTHRVGGNTSCVEVMCGDTRVVFDAGTGLRSLGDRLVRSGPSETHILLSHVHWDHIQGFPFFVPIYVPGHHVQIMSGPNGLMPLEDVMRLQMSPPVFPVVWDEIRQQVSVRELRSNDKLHIGEIKVTVGKLNHPDPVYAYRLDYGGRSLVYATDTEHFSVVDPALRKLCQDADVLIYDAMYTPEEYPTKVGWGHSTYQAGIELVRAAGVKSLVLFHHDPSRSDADIDALEARARDSFPAVVAAREGLVIDVGDCRRSQVGEDQAHAA